MAKHLGHFNGQIALFYDGFSGFYLYRKIYSCYLYSPKIHCRHCMGAQEIDIFICSLAICEIVLGQNVHFLSEIEL
jgi:hypothetical protein